jgi:hypothetical protein
VLNRAIGYSHPDVKIIFREGDKEPVYAPFVKHYPPETAAAIFWLKNRQPERWRERHEVKVADPLASMTPEQRFAQVLDIMARARALRGATPDDEVEGITNVAYEEVEE